MAIWKKDNKTDKYNPPDSKLFKEIEKKIYKLSGKVFNNSALPLKGFTSVLDLIGERHANLRV